MVFGLLLSLGLRCNEKLCFCALHQIIPYISTSGGVREKTKENVEYGVPKIKKKTKPCDYDSVAVNHCNKSKGFSAVEYLICILFRAVFHKHDLNRALNRHKLLLVIHHPLDGSVESYNDGLENLVHILKCLKYILYRIHFDSRLILFSFSAKVIKILCFF